jgi:hypothetical protein
MQKCRFKIVLAGETTVQKDIELASVNDAWEFVFEHLNSLPPDAILEIKSEQGERVISVGAAAAKNIRDMRSDRRSYSTENHVVPL